MQEKQFNSEELLDQWRDQMDQLGKMLIDIKLEMQQLKQENQILRECLADSYAIINVCDR